MVERTDDISTNESDDSHTEASSKYWDEAVSVRVDGKDAPPEEKSDSARSQGPLGTEDNKETEVAESEETEVESPDEPEETTPDSEPEEPEEGDEDAQEEEDPWDGVPITLREQFEEVNKKAEKYEHEAKSNRGRLGALQREFNELSRKLQEREATATKDEKAAPPVDPGDTLFEDDKWKKFKEEFGEVAEPIESTMRGLYKALHSRLQDTDKVSQELRQKHDQQYMVEQAAKLEAERPGWRQYIDEHRTDFDDYVAGNPVARELLAPNEQTLTDAEKAKALVDLFKLHMNEKNPAPAVESKPKSPQQPRPLTPKRKQQLKSAATPAPRSHPAPGRRSDDLPDPDAYDDAFRYFSELATR